MRGRLAGGLAALLLLVVLPALAAPTFPALSGRVVDQANIIPPAVSIWEASAPPQSQGFMLVGALFIIPFILGYTAWSYYVFRGKVKHGDGYH